MPQIFSTFAKTMLRSLCGTYTFAIVSPNFQQLPF